ncbi:MAG: TlpA family protein disulfide reductase [Acidobacteria bacterium]|nr:TlpA family protein disulfide reductase [Acidobacteriota bacterium]
MRKFLLACTVFLAPLWASGELSNRRAPGFSLPDSSIRQHDLADYRGKVVVLEIMLTTCPHCVKFAPILEEVQKKYAGRVQVLSITTPPDTTTTVGKFIRERGLSYPVLFDCGQAAGSYMLATPQKPSFDVPHIFLIDQNGFIKNDFGYDVLTTQIFEGRALFTEIDKLLGTAPAAPPSKKTTPKK